MKKVLVLSVGISAVVIEQKEANSFLRSRRSNTGSWFFEELKEGDLKRECYDEVCSYSEAMEAIENVPSMIAFWDFHNDPCESFGLCFEECRNGNNGMFECICGDGHIGIHCNTNCNRLSDPVSLTNTLGPEAFTATSNSNNFSPEKAKYAPFNDEILFDVASGGFPNVWKAMTGRASETDSITIDLGQLRTVKQLLIRGGHHFGTICTPEEMEIRIAKTVSALKSAEVTGISLTPVVKPQLISLRPIYGQFVQISAVTNRSSQIPPCFALDVLGFGGTELPTDFCN